jgi:Phytanoyl-CoA dioxygenase (PhyH)
MNFENHLQRFVRDGYTVFPAVHGEGLMRRWRDAYQPLCDAASLPGQAPMVWLSDLLEVAPALFLPMVAHPQLLDFAEAVMGPFVQLDGTAFNVFPNLDPAQATGKVNGWHRDRYAFVPQTRDYVRPLCINAITYLQDLTAATGPLRVIAGSHRDPVVFTALERGRPHPREILLEPRAGDVVVAHGLLAHSGSPNTSGGPRYFLSASLNLCWLKHRDALSGPRVAALVADARARRDRRMLRLLGQDELLWERSNPYFETDDDTTRWQRWQAEDRALLLKPPQLEANP